jgi:hypothetical protein
MKLKFGQKVKWGSGKTICDGVITREPYMTKATRNCPAEECVEIRTDADTPFGRMVCIVPVSDVIAD